MNGKACMNYGLTVMRQGADHHLAKLLVKAKHDEECEHHESLEENEALPETQDECCVSDNNDNR